MSKQQQTFNSPQFAECSLSTRESFSGFNSKSSLGFWNLLPVLRTQLSNTAVPPAPHDRGHAEVECFPE